MPGVIMKTIALLCCFLIPFAASAQTMVDRAANDIDSLCVLSYTNWKMSPEGVRQISERAMAHLRAQPKVQALSIYLESDAI